MIDFNLHQIKKIDFVWLKKNRQLYFTVILSQHFHTGLYTIDKVSFIETCNFMPVYFCNVVRQNVNNSKTKFNGDLMGVYYYSVCDFIFYLNNMKGFKTVTFVQT